MIFQQLSFVLSLLILHPSHLVNSYKLIHNTRQHTYTLSAHAAPVDTAASLKDTVARALSAQFIHKKLSLLGSTGSIGTQTLDICREQPEHFKCVAMAAGNNLDLLAQQIVEFKPKLVSIQESSKIDELRRKLKSMGMDDSSMPDFAAGEAGIVAVATHPDCDTVVTGIVGCAGLLPTVAAIKAGKDIALANKETLIAGFNFHKNTLLLIR